MWKLGGKGKRKAFQHKLKKLVSAKAEILLVHLGIEFGRLVKNFVEREGEEGSKGKMVAEVQEAAKRKANAFGETCMIRTEKIMMITKKKGQTKKIVNEAVMGKAEQEMNNFYNGPNNVFKLIKFLEKEGRDVSGEQCLKEINGIHVFSGGLKERVERTMSGESV